MFFDLCVMMIDIPEENIKEARYRILYSLKEGTRQEQKRVYRHIISTISHPLAIYRIRCINGAAKLQHSLNAIIITSKIMYIAFLLLGLFANKWLLVGIPLWFFCDLLLFNRIQTSINLELASRLIALDELMDKDENFCTQALAVLSGSCVQK